jgi:hypothetical protein
LPNWDLIYCQIVVYRGYWIAVTIVLFKILCTVKEGVKKKRRRQNKQTNKKTHKKDNTLF